MQESTASNTELKLHRALNLKDLVLLNITCIFGFSSLAQVAQFGFASMPLYILAILAFLIPTGLVVAELNARMPEEGGFYLWTRSAFGDFHGYVAAWTYWLSNIVWLPTVMLLVPISCLYIFGDNLLFLAENPWYNGLVALGLLWIVTLLNIIGMERAKWVQNIGGIATWISIVLLLILGIIFVTNNGSAHPFNPEKLIPDITDFSLLPFFAIVAFSFGGLELAPVMAGEIQNPKRNIPRAIFISSIAVGFIYIVGTLMLILIVSEGEIGIIEGVAQAFHQVSSSLSMPWLGTFGVILVTLSFVGLFGSWMTGTARIPFVIGLNHYLPDVVAKVHPKWGSPYVSLIMQGIVLSLLVLGSMLGSTIKEAYLILLDMSIILYFIPILYMFAALIVHLKRNTGGEGIIPIFAKRKAAIWLVFLSGFGITLFSGIISAVPTKDIENKAVFVVKVVGGAALLIGAGLIVYFLKRKNNQG
jgi:glutamate:GABA antiporter